MSETDNMFLNNGNNEGIFTTSNRIYACEDDFDVFYGWFEDKLEVIGNIYDNSELIK